MLLILSLIDTQKSANFDVVIDRLVTALVHLISLTSLGFNEAHRNTILEPAFRLLSTSNNQLKPRFLIGCIDQKDRTSKEWTVLFKALQDIAKEASSGEHAKEWAEVLKVLIDHETAAGQLGRTARGLKEDITLFCV